MSANLKIGIVLAGLLAGAAHAATANAVAPAAAQRPATVLAVQPVYTPAMQSLRDAAQALRESIQDLAQKPPGPERQVAIDKARAALARTQQAMLDLPPQDRITGTVSSTANYDQSVKRLMAAADKLRDSVQEMATQPAGPRRNEAIRDANRALLQTQVAMSNAYDLTAFGDHGKVLGAGSRTKVLGAGSGHCMTLPDNGMLACH